MVFGPKGFLDLSLRVSEGSCKLNLHVTIGPRFSVWGCWMGAAGQAELCELEAENV